MKPSIKTVVSYYHLERDSDKVFKFCVNSSSNYEVSDFGGAY